MSLWKQTNRQTEMRFREKKKKIFSSSIGLFSIYHFFSSHSSTRVVWERLYGVDHYISCSKCWRRFSILVLERSGFEVQVIRPMKQNLPKLVSKIYKTMNYFLNRENHLLINISNTKWCISPYTASIIKFLRREGRREYFISRPRGHRIARSSKLISFEQNMRY
jgi:hypothetical protein